jgi:hypothetical protein
LATAVFAGGEPRPNWWHHDSPYGIIAVAASGRVLYTDNVSDLAGPLGRLDDTISGQNNGDRTEEGLLADIEVPDLLTPRGRGERI